MTISIRTTAVVAATTILSVLAGLTMLGADQAAEKAGVQQLPRVVVTGSVQRDVATVAVLPRVIVTGQVQRTAAIAVVELPRVVVTGRVDRRQAVLTAANDGAPRS